MKKTTTRISNNLPAVQIPMLLKVQVDKLYSKFWFIINMHFLFVYNVLWFGDRQSLNLFKNLITLRRSLRLWLYVTVNWRPCLMPWYTHYSNFSFPKYICMNYWWKKKRLPLPTFYDNQWNVCALCWYRCFFVCFLSIQASILLCLYLTIFLQYGC